MVTRITLLGLLLGASVLLAGTTYAEETKALTMCPGYRTALQDARGALSRGERTEAVAALQRAKAALQRCNREESRRASLIAAVSTGSALAS